MPAPECSFIFIVLGRKQQAPLKLQTCITLIEHHVYIKKEGKEVYQVQEQDQ